MDCKLYSCMTSKNTESMLLETDPEIVTTRKKIKVMDEEIQLAVRRLAIVALTLGVCIYCLYFCEHCLLVIMMVSACFCQCSSVMFFPFFCSLAFYIGSHIPTLEQIFTISEDIYKFHEKYK
jgi:uncharacterized membrane protein